MRSIGVGKVAGFTSALCAVSPARVAQSGGPSPELPAALYCGSYRQGVPLPFPLVRASYCASPLGLKLRGIVILYRLPPSGLPSPGSSGILGLPTADHGCSPCASRKPAKSLMPEKSCSRKMSRRKPKTASRITELRERANAPVVG